MFAVHVLCCFLRSGPPSVDLWLSISSAFEDYPRLHILEAGHLGWQDHLFLATSGEDLGDGEPGLGHSVTSMCLVNSAVWMGDNLGHIHAYSADTCRKLFTYKMEPDELEDASPVRSLHFLSELQRVCVAMHNGRMFLCCADVVPAAREGLEGTFLVTELGSATCIHSVTSVFTPGGGRSSSAAAGSAEIWCGESHGAVSVFTLMEGVVTSQEVVNHNDPVVDNLEVLQVISARDGDGGSSGGGGGGNLDAVWTFVYPGCHIYQWRTGQQGARTVRSRLDCSKLVPSSESLRAIAGIDEYFSPGRCQISSMCVQRGKLYAGTSWGCLVVADAASMRPLSVFRPYSQEIQAIIPMRASALNPGASSKSKKSNKASKGEEDDDLLLVTLGRGYRSLIGRFVADARSSGWSKVRTSKGGDDGDEEGDEESSRSMTALLWRPDDWLAD